MPRTGDTVQALRTKQPSSPDKLAHREVDWPAPPDPAAFHGLAGAVVRAIEPHTEADPVALLVQFLVAFGNTVGRCAHFLADGAEHYANLFIVLVGATSKGRKGSAWSNVRRVLEATCPEWVKSSIVNGLSSGEGLIWAVRDPIEKREPIREKGKITGEYEIIIADHGVEDKRLLVLEAEYASVLRVLGRDGNTLSPTVRQAWDTGNLRTLTKNSPARATGAHISIVGHITRDELLRHLNSTEAGNGFGNRFLWLCVCRSQCLPEGGQINEVDFTEIAEQLQAAIAFADVHELIVRDDDARALWADVYPDLSDGKPGMFGAVTSRAEAQTMRLAMIYALLDCSPVIKVEHLQAALALWRYAEDSARYIFGEALGDPIADEILANLRLRADGMTRTEISALFRRHKTADQITRALTLLSRHGLARVDHEKTDGRSVERWYAVVEGAQEAQ